MLSFSPETRKRLQEQYANAPIDIPSFFRHYRACARGECLGLCCNGGAGFYYDEESDTIARVAKEHKAFFERNNLPLPADVFSYELNEDTGKMDKSTEVREVAWPPGFLPKHFPETACIFRRADGACSLQVLSSELGHDGWWYKPLACWLFPIELEYDGKPLIRVAHHSTDEYVDEEYPGFVGFTKCGAECASDGMPAYQLLQKEIASLSEMLGRDLMAEIMAYKHGQGE